MPAMPLPAAHFLDDVRKSQDMLRRLNELLIETKTAGMPTTGLEETIVAAQRRLRFEYVKLAKEVMGSIDGASMECGQETPPDLAMNWAWDDGFKYGLNSPSASENEQAEQRRACIARHMR